MPLAIGGLAKIVSHTRFWW